MPDRHFDPYEVLQVARNAEPEVIVAAYRKLALKYHPDRYRGSDAHKKMKDLNRAYEILSDPRRRRAYDTAHPQSETSHPRPEGGAGLGGGIGGRTPNDNEAETRARDAEARAREAEARARDAEARAREAEEKARQARQSRRQRNIIKAAVAIAASAGAVGMLLLAVWISGGIGGPSGRASTPIADQAVEERGISGVPEETVEAFVDAFNDRDAGKMYDLFSRGCKEDISREEFEKGFKLGLAFIGDSKIKLESVDVKTEGDQATVDIKGKFEGGPLEGEDAEDDTGVGELRKEDGKWKIADCSSIEGIAAIDTATREGTETAEETGTAQATETAAEETETAEEAEEEETVVEEPEATGTAPVERKELPDGYPEDVVPVIEGGLVTEVSYLTFDTQLNFSILYLLKGKSAEEIVEFYAERVRGLEWSINFSSSSSEEEASLVAGKGVGDSEGSLILGVGPSSDAPDFLEVNIFITVPAP